MMKKVYTAGDNLISSLGFTSSENFNNLKANISGLHKTGNVHLSTIDYPFGRIDDILLNSKFDNLCNQKKIEITASAFTRMEKLFLLSISDALNGFDYKINGEDTILIISTTKGNIDLLEEEKGKLFETERVFLWRMAEVIKDFLGLKNTPYIISNACISGVLAIGTAYRFLKMGRYKNAIVTGGDILSEFVVSGFQSFQALSPEPCKPYDLNRTGLSIGEGCGTLILTTDPEKSDHSGIMIMGMATSNDANHISGPSRTGEELALAITRAMNEAEVLPSQVSFLSAHGTATPFNDEMEAKAFALAGLSHVQMNSFKRYWGHTLGAAGVVESVASIQSMKQNLLIKSAGFETLGVSENLTLIDRNLNYPVDHVVKTASGFGGCNAAIVFGKE